MGQVAKKFNQNLDKKPNFSQWFFCGKALALMYACKLHMSAETLWLWSGHALAFWKIAIWNPKFCQIFPQKYEKFATKIENFAN